MSVAGEFDVDAVSEFRAALDGVDLSTLVAIDLGEMSFIDSTGLGALIGVTKRASRSGGRVVLRNASDRTYKLLRITGLEKSREALERLRRSAAMGGLPRDACEELLGEVGRLRRHLVDVDGDLAKVEAILHRARARLRV